MKVAKKCITYSIRGDVGICIGFPALSYPIRSAGDSGSIVNIGGWECPCIASWYPLLVCMRDAPSRRSSAAVGRCVAIARRGACVASVWETPTRRTTGLSVFCLIWDVNLPPSCSEEVWSSLFLFPGPFSSSFFLVGVVSSGKALRRDAVSNSTLSMWRTGGRWQDGGPSRWRWRSCCSTDRLFSSSLKDIVWLSLVVFISFLKRDVLIILVCSNFTAAAFHSRKTITVRRDWDFALVGSLFSFRMCECVSWCEVSFMFCFQLPSGHFSTSHVT